MVEAVGTCYEDAWRFLLKEEEGELIHGSVQLSAEGPRVNHAWVELPTGWVWEPQTKSYFTIEDFKIMAPLEEHRYSVTEAAIMLARVGKHGPWTEQERQMLKRDNPDDKRLLKVAIEREPLRVAKQLGYEIHRLSPKGIVDKDDYARGYRYRLSKTDPAQPYPQIVMARSESEVATFLKGQIEGNPGNPRHLKLGEKYYYECEVCGIEAIGTVKQMPDEVISQIGGGKLAVYLDYEPCRHRSWKLKGLKSGGNPGRVYYARADIGSAIEAAKRLKSERDLYIFATYLGYTIEGRPPPGMQSYVVVHPDGATEAIKPGIEGNPKEYWQMTLAEYKKTLVKPSDRVAWGNHYVYVKQALEDGLPVPAEVLADYPDLRTREGNPDTGTSIIDLRGDYDEIAHVKDGILYRKGNIVQVWWDKWGKETWTGHSEEQAKENFNAMKERWSSSKGSTPYLEEGERIARQLGNGVVYNGSQMYHDKIYTHFFTDAAVTGTTFACLDFEECKATLIRSRKAFGAAPPIFSEFTPEVQAVIDKWKGQVVKGEPLVESEARREIIRAGKYKLGVGKTDEAIRAIKEGNVYTKPETPVVSEPVAFQKRLEHELKRAGFIAEPKGDNPMAKPEQERLSFHERIFGKGSTPPLERLGGGKVVNDLLPMPPESGPPLPRVLGLKWPWKD